MSRSLSRLGMTAAGIALCAAALLGAAAIAQNAPTEDHFANRDANHDGFIDKSEASQRMAARFDTIDADHDGKISRDELKASWQGRMTDGADGHGWRHHHHDFAGRHLADLDSNHDGKLSLDEMTARAKSRFDRMDTNHDGFIDAGEMPKPGEHKNWRHGDGSSATGR